MVLDILIDNLPAENGCNSSQELHYEHGLCIHFTLDGKHWLVDTGASGKAFENLEKLGICNIGEIESVFISHGHNDHTGGLRRFIENNPTAPVYLNNTIRGNLFFSCRPRTTANIREFRSIGMEQALFAEYADRFREIASPTEITDKITLIPITGEKNYPTPMGNEFLYQNDFPDDFSHETAILIQYNPGKYAVISPCTHNGILNVLECCSRWRKLQGKDEITHFIGGLHYVDYLAAEGENKEAAQIIGTALKLKELYPQLNVLSGHCTCSNAGKLMESLLGENYITFRTGTQITISSNPSLGTKCTPSLR